MGKYLQCVGEIMKIPNFQTEAMNYYKKVSKSAYGYFLTTPLNFFKEDMIINKLSEELEIYLIGKRTHINNGNLYQLNSNIKNISFKDAFDLEMSEADLLIINLCDGYLEDTPMKELRKYFMALRYIIKKKPTLIIANTALPFYALSIINIPWKKFSDYLGLKNTLELKNTLRWVLF
jgi:hypothetical protein